MKKGYKFYKFSFIINIDHYDDRIYCSLFAQNDDEALNKLPNKIQKRISFITINIKEIYLVRKNETIRYFYN